MISDEPDVADVNKVGGVHHLEESGVTSGFNFLPFHVYGHSGKHLFSGEALGQRNLAFRQAEATSGGFGFKACTGPDCKHESMEQ